MIVMPYKPLKPCLHPGCPKRVKSGYCPDHKHLSNKFATSKSDPWYNLPIWKGNPNKPHGKRGGLREAQIMNVPYCEHCKEHGIVKDVTGKRQAVVDHIIPFRSGDSEEKQWSLFTDPDNHQTLCNDCNRTKTSKDSHIYRRQ